MSLASTSPDFLADLSSLIDGCDVINLIKCGNKRLIKTLQSTPLLLEFCVCHVGFLAFDDVLLSLSRYLPSTIDAVFIAPDGGETGLTPELSAPDPQPSKLKGVSLPHLRTFSVVGCEAFVFKAAMRCLKHLVRLEGLGSINALFPKVHTWIIGDFVHLYYRSWLVWNDNDDEYYGLEKTSCDSLARLIPQSVTSLSMSAHNRPLMDQQGLFMTRYLKALLPNNSVMMHHLALPNFCLTNEMLKLPQLQQLTTLFTMWGDATLSMADLPRTLTWFGVSHKPASLRMTRTITLIDAPPQLVNISIDYGSLFIIKEPLPRHLETLEFSAGQDDSFFLSAITLPPSLTLLSVGYMVNSANDETNDGFKYMPNTRVDIGSHLFRNADMFDAEWARHWPPTLKIPNQKDSLTNVLANHMVMMMHLPQCVYTLNHSNREATDLMDVKLTLDYTVVKAKPHYDMPATDPLMYSLTDDMIDSQMHNLISQFDDAPNEDAPVADPEVDMYADWLERYGDSFQLTSLHVPLLHICLRCDDWKRIVNRHIVAIRVETDVASEEQQFILNHIDKVMLNVTKLQYFEHAPLKEIPKWVKSLHYTHPVGEFGGGSSSGSYEPEERRDSDVRSDDLALTTSQVLSRQRALLSGEEDDNTTSSDAGSEDANDFSEHVAGSSSSSEEDVSNAHYHSASEDSIDEYLDYNDEVASVFEGRLNSINLDSDSIPDILWHLPMGLTALEFTITQPLLTQLANEFASFVATLPRSLLYFNVESYHAGADYKLDISGVAIALPPNLRRLYCPAFRLTCGFSDLYRLCHHVSDIPSLRLLTVSFRFKAIRSPHSHYLRCKTQVASYHCLSVTKKDAYLQWCIKESMLTSDLLAV